MPQMSEARKRANAKYNAKAYERVSFQFPRGWKAKAQESAQAQNESLAKYVREAVERRMAEEKEDMDFCVAMVDRYLADPDKGEFVTIEEAMKESGVTL